ncbi:MAG: hypothetical protein KC505_10925, partial [Myxococcales bacterium]|nr:hypothetical protein [Myxococcales bacterium]
QDLDATLQLILQDPKLLNNASCNAVYKYWAKDRNSVFLVEAYAPSKIIHVQGKSYDATLRIAFCMHRMNGKIHVHILDGFWKFPPKSLEEKGSLIDKHISNVYVGSGIRSAKVSTSDMQHIRQIMPPLLKKVYNNILKKNKYRHHINLNEHKRELRRKGLL